ncbi:unnamed protein product, partial [Ascophyllum nodosum]
EGCGRGSNGEWARRFGSGAKHIVKTRPFCPRHSIFQRQG